jgi:hypothetical protein
MLNRNRILIAEAKSAITQCCALLGQDRTNRILAELDEAEADLQPRG